MKNVFQRFVVTHYTHDLWFCCSVVPHTLTTSSVRVLSPWEVPFLLLFCLLFRWAGEVTHSTFHICTSIHIHILRSTTRSLWSTRIWMFSLGSHVHRSRLTRLEMTCHITTYTKSVTIWHGKRVIGYDRSKSVGHIIFPIRFRLNLVKYVVCMCSMSEWLFYNTLHVRVNPSTLRSDSSTYTLDPTTTSTQSTQFQFHITQSLQFNLDISPTISRYHREPPTRSETDNNNDNKNKHNNNNCCWLY